jgi:hypothetical protein
MPDYPDIPPGFAIPLVDTATDIFDAATMSALDDRYVENTMFSLIRTAAFNFTSGSGTPLAWSSVIEESSETPAALVGFSTADWIEFTCTEAGLYLVDVMLTAAAQNGSVAGDVYKNGALRRAAIAGPTVTTGVTVHPTVVSRFEVGDTFKVHARAGATIAGALGTGWNGLTVVKLSN